MVLVTPILLHVPVGDATARLLVPIDATSKHAIASDHIERGTALFRVITWRANLGESLRTK